jgi:hypothetical protein
MIAATIRDIAIIIIAVQSIVIGILLGLLVWQIWRLVKMLQNEVQPILKDAQDTVSTVRGTTTFVSENVVTPVVKTSSTIVGMRRTVSSLTADLRRPRRRRATSAPPPAPDATATTSGSAPSSRA